MIYQVTNIAASIAIGSKDRCTVTVVNVLSAFDWMHSELSFVW